MKRTLIGVLQFTNGRKKPVEVARFMDVERVFQVVFANVFQIFQVAGLCISTCFKLGPVIAKTMFFQPFLNVLLFIQKSKPNH